MKRIYRRSRASSESLRIAKNLANQATSRLRAAFRKKEGLEEALNDARIALQKSAITVRNEFSNSKYISELSSHVGSEELILIFLIYEVEKALHADDYAPCELSRDESTKAINELYIFRRARFIDVP